MSDDSQKKSEELDFSDLGFDPFKDSNIISTEKKEEPVVGIQDETLNAADSGFDLPPIESEAAVSETSNIANDAFASLTSDNDEPSAVESLTDLPSASATVDVAAEKGKGKKNKKKKEKISKPKKEKKKSEKTQEPIGVGGMLCLVSGSVLLALLLIADVLMFIKPSLVLGETSVGSSSILYYVIVITVVGLAGIVAVPFAFFINRKETDVFKVALGISVMTMSMSVIFLITEHVRYDFTVKAPAVSALSMPVGTPVTPATP